MQLTSILPQLPYTAPVANFFMQVQADAGTKADIENECQHIARMLRVSQINCKVLEFAVKKCAERDCRHV